ncbi:MAG TPA: DUF4380 domain-containing protein [Methylomirabilota bacterium]|nr:DUF4380 domain-containing protein [Methylomirabilota bacterium]
MMHTHRGWPGSYVLRNREVEAVVVPAVGRVMQFGFKGRPGVFWENADLVGQPADPEAPEWINFGGDKAWPAPEGEWSRVTGAARWKPPAAFDGMAWTARRDGDAVIMTSPEDPAYGVRVERRVELDPKEPVMRIATTFERVRGEPLRLSVWVVTQLNHPEAVFAETGREATRPGHHVVLGKEVPPSLTVQDGLAGLIRDPGQAYKIGAGGGRLVWVGREAVLRIDSERVHGADYPDRGSSVEIYTNPDPLTYIELETLGPLQTMRPGDRLTRTNVYRLFKRSRLEPEAEARRVLKR